MAQLSTFCLSCTVSSELLDASIASWYVLGMTGCEESMTTDTIAVKLYFTTSNELAAVQNDILGQAPNTECSVTEIPNQDWNAQWKASMKPVIIAPGIVVSPCWLPPEPGTAEHWIKIEPKMAFGTGHHATTKLAAAAVQRTAQQTKPGFSLLDIGSGTGVLCFIAELNGAGFTVGIDIDRVCGENMAENRRFNPAQIPCGLLIAGTLDIFKPSAKFDCVVMNMIRTESEPLTQKVHTMLSDGGRLIWSGILIDEKQSVIDVARTRGYEILEETHEEEWWCGIFTVVPIP